MLDVETSKGSPAAKDVTTVYRNKHSNPMTEWRPSVVCTCTDIVIRCLRAVTKSGNSRARFVSHFAWVRLRKFDFTAAHESSAQHSMGQWTKAFKSALLA